MKRVSNALILGYCSIIYPGDVFWTEARILRNKEDSTQPTSHFQYRDNPVHLASSRQSP